jgi:hypothetical protein
MAGQNLTGNREFRRKNDTGAEVVDRACDQTDNGKAGGSTKCDLTLIVVAHRAPDKGWRPWLRYRLLLGQTVLIKEKMHTSKA